MSPVGIDKKILAWTAVLALLPFLASAQLAQPKAWTTDDIKNVLTLIANFLIAVGIIGAVITLVTAGIIYFASGFNAKAVAKARGLFRSALIGTLLIVGAGVIINTIGVIITGEFFGLPSGGGPGGAPGDACASDADCTVSSQKDQPGTFCVADVCTRGICSDPKDCTKNPVITGNLAGESCRKTSNCASGLACQGIKDGVGKCKR